jgi:branched-chain amino acid transport system ATP-binding protein
MDVIKRLADRIVVLQDGAMIADGPPAEVVALPAVQQAYLGMQTGAKPRHEAGHG